jgi:hypothetical protein
MTTSTTLIIAATAAAGLIVGSLEYHSRSNVVTAGFWFDDSVTFEVHDPQRLGGAITPLERERIQRVARAEVEAAFADFRIRITDSREAFYRVAVRQVLTVNRRLAAAGQSNVFGPLGGDGAVSFVTLAAQAMSYAPAEAGRPEIIDAIGRGIGRAAVHEFVHQILPKGPVHTSQDPASYEFWSSDRPAQYYGVMHWSVAREPLRERLGR